MKSKYLIDKDGKPLEGPEDPRIRVMLYWDIARIIIVVACATITSLYALEKAF